MNPRHLLSLATICFFAACGGQQSPGAADPSGPQTPEPAPETNTGASASLALPRCVEVGRSDAPKEGDLCDGGTAKAASEGNAEADAACALSLAPQPDTKGCVEPYANGGWGYWSADLSGADKLGDCKCVKP